jgi:hypothetical protein
LWQSLEHGQFIKPSTASLPFFAAAWAGLTKAGELAMDNNRFERTESNAPRPLPNVGHVLVAFDALKVSRVPVFDLIEELERRGFDSAASVRAFDQAVFDGLLRWTEGNRLIKQP